MYLLESICLDTDVLAPHSGGSGYVHSCLLPHVGVFSRHFNPLGPDSVARSVIGPHGVNVRFTRMFSSATCWKMNA